MWRQTIGGLCAQLVSLLDTESVLLEVEHLKPTWPRKELAEVLKALDTMRFAPIYGSTDVLQLYQRGVQLAQALEAGGK